MRSIFSFLIIFFVHNFSYSENNLLYSAYKSSSKHQLETLAKHWKNDIKPLSYKELAKLNDTTSQVYNLVSVFLNDLLFDSTHQFFKNKYSSLKTPYFILQNEIEIYFNDKIYYSKLERDSMIFSGLNLAYKNDTQRLIKYLKKQNGDFMPFVLENFAPTEFYSYSSYPKIKLKNFRPNISNKKLAPLFLNSKYIEEINNFFTMYNPNDDLLHAGNESNKSEVNSRLKFVNEVINIQYDYFSNTYSSSNIEKITFDKNMEFAIILILNSDYSYEAVYKYYNNHWSFIKSINLIKFD